MRMTPVWSERMVARGRLLDRQCVVWLQGCRASAWMNWPMVAVSKLGDGALWIAAMLLLPWIDGQAGLMRMWQLLLLGGINVGLYLWIKRRIARPRPCHACEGVRAHTRPLDTFSFPSGHTLHAVAFTLVLSHHYPAASAALWGFCVLVAASRVVLGLHYPSDVVCAALLAAFTAEAVLLLG